MLGAPCDARASYGQAGGLPMAAAADLGDEADARIAQDGACHARHAACCPCSSAAVCGRTRDASGLPSTGGGAAQVSAPPAFAEVACWVVDRCLAYERGCDPGLDLDAAREQILGLAPYLERWYARSAVVPR